MALIDTNDILKLTSTLMGSSLAGPAASSPGHILWTRYDQEADVLYINLQKPAIATDSELTDQDIIVRYHNDQVIGYTVLHASTRKVPA
jgi:uncharacterized protein YuzE